ncbi:MAG: cobalt-precorrin-5B (C(1))-methyltransferase CbiD [Bacteroides sp.]|nr:cobalt-precorrin-5B (C(1))-methyltransferase CbiD [Bacteroides sp.]
MILILGGTTEGRIAAETLEEAGKPFYYSTKGSEQEVTLHNGIRLQGAMDAIDLEGFCRKHDIRLLIDAAHPFAQQLHETVEEVADKLSLIVLRYEHIFTQRYDDDITWCDDYDDAIRQIKGQEIYKLLALTGVQSIGKLQPLWQESACCYFRILDRDSSREIARRQCFPEEHLFYYHAGEDERSLMQQLRPEAILIKESGLSGGFVQKVEAVLELGIRIFALCCPPTPGTFLPVDGPHGLRRRVEQILPDFYPLHTGLTTDTYACATAVAAIWDIFNITHQTRPGVFPVILPNGETIMVPVEAQKEFPRSDSFNGNWMLESEASAIKDAGDDPDITNGMQIKAHIGLTFRMDDHLELGPETDDYNIIIAGGEGVGIVTKPGLGLEVGAPAINATPRRMIEKNVKTFLEQFGLPKQSGPVVVTISVPGGEEIARRTFNPRLGVEGGISIIGTSGIVKPFSTEAFINSIRKSMEVARATGSPLVVISSGAKSERYIKARYPDLPAQAFVHYGNFIGETLKLAAELGMPRITLGVMMGKAVKLAEGNLDTHSKKVTMNKEFLQGLIREAGCGEETATAAGQMNLARELWDIIPSEQLPGFCRVLIEYCHRCCDPLLPDGELTILLINENGTIHT